MKYWLTLFCIAAVQSALATTIYYALEPVGRTLASIFAYSIFAGTALILAYRTVDKDIRGGSSVLFLAWLINGALLLGASKDPRLAAILAVGSALGYAYYRQFTMAMLSVCVLIVASLVILSEIGENLAISLIQIMWVVQCTLIVSQWLELKMGKNPKSIKKWLYWHVMGIDVTGKMRRV